MQTFKLAARPAVFLALWIIASAHTISELSTVGPALVAAQASTGADATAAGRVRRLAAAPVRSAGQRSEARRAGSR